MGQLGDIRKFSVQVSAVSHLKSPRIAIVGAGLAGLSTQLHLQRLGFKGSTVYERDTSFASRTHIGGILDMHIRTGQAALNAAGILWRDHVNKGAQLQRYYNMAGDLVYQHDRVSDEDSKPEIDRTTLRRLLYEACDPETIQWGKGVSSVAATKEGAFQLSFADGSSTVADLVVGADGAWSRVRKLVTQEEPSFAGITGAEISLAPDVAASPELADVVKLVSPGTAMVIHQGVLLFIQRQGTGRVRTYVWFTADDPESFVLPTSDVARTRELLLTKLEGWGPWTHELVKKCDPTAIYPRPMWVLPVGYRWEHRRGVTLIGDAGHLMLPNGEGANLALVDGLDLAEALAKARGEANREDSMWWDGAVIEFEKKMLDRAEELNTGPDMMKGFISQTAEEAVRYFPTD